MASLSKKWEAANGRPGGFDFLRIALSISVILWHSVATSYGQQAEVWFYAGPLKPLVWFILPAFFALSGFLVAGSLERNNLTSFFSLRVIRIFPALSAEVIISALLIGPLFTTLALRQYFTNPEFFSYFLNTIGYIHFSLPGVFNDLPTPGLVNSQLWTIPHELECYLALGAAGLIGLTRRRGLFLIAVLTIIAAFALRDYFGDRPGSPTAPPGRMLVLAFLCGVALYLNRAHMTYSRWVLLVSVIAWSVSVYAATRLGEDLASIFVAYITVYLGLLNFRAGLITKMADYSYGIYLYGFPVQQAVSALMPGHRVWYINFGVSLAIAFVFAMASWHFLEARVMAKKKPILASVSTIESSVRRYFSMLWEMVARRAPTPANSTSAEREIRTS